MSLFFLLFLFSSCRGVALPSTPDETIDLSSHAPLRIFLDEMPTHSNYTNGQFVRNVTDSYKGWSLLHLAWHAFYWLMLVVGTVRSQSYKGTWSVRSSGNCTSWTKFKKTSGTLSAEVCFSPARFSFCKMIWELCVLTVLHSSSNVRPFLRHSISCSARLPSEMASTAQISMLVMNFRVRKLKQNCFLRASCPTISRFHLI